MSGVETRPRNLFGLPAYMNPKNVFLKYAIIFFLLTAGVIVFLEFLINYKTIFLFYECFIDKNNFRADFEAITHLMVSRLLLYNKAESEKWVFFDFYKSACNIAAVNNLITFFAALIEVAAFKEIKKMSEFSERLSRLGYRFFIAICLLQLILIPISCHASGI